MSNADRRIRQIDEIWFPRWALNTRPFGLQPSASIAGLPRAQYFCEFKLLNYHEEYVSNIFTI
jgi:hypothetical protein